MNINLNLNLIRYINLLEKITKVRAKNCFVYNNTIFFVVLREDVGRTIGKNGEKVRLLNKTLKKKIKIIPAFNKKSKKEIINFVKNLIEPIKIEDIKVKYDELEIKAGIEERSLIIGRNRTREKELLKLLGHFFNIKKIIFVK